MNTLRGLLLLAAACASAPPAGAQPVLAGDPPFTRLTPDIEVYPQNFAIAQDASGVLYVGNNEGVLIYDGARWRLLKLPNEDLVRALAYDGGARVYVGGFDTFGYLERDATGRAVYHDLAARFAPLLNGDDFADIWDVHIAPQGVFFRALRHVFRFDPASGATALWRHEGRFGAIVGHDGAIVLQFRGVGLKELAGEDWRLLTGSESLTELVYELVPLPDDGGLLTLAADGQWRVYREGRVEAMRMPAGFPPSSDISSALVLADGTLALVADDGQAYFFDPRSGAFRKFQLDRGYLNRVIQALDGGLLVAGDHAIYRVQWPAAWTVLGPAHGLAGNLHDVARWGARWFALTGSGVQEIVPLGDGSSTFQPRAWTDAEAWDLLPLDARRALLAESYAVKAVGADGAARAVTHNALYPRLFLRSRFDADTVWAGLEPGLAVLRDNQGQWRLVFEKTDMQNLRVLSLLETARGEIWVGSERGGIWRVRLGADYRQLLEAHRFGPDDGLVYGAVPGGTLRQMPDGALVAATSAGFFRWTGTRFESTDLDGLAPLREEDDALDPLVAHDGTRWAYSYRNVFREETVRGAGATSRRWRREDVGSLARGVVENLRFDGGQVLLSTGNGVLLFDAAAAASDRGAAPPRPLLHAIELAEAGGARRALPLDGPLSLPQGDYTLSFRFALPDYERPEAVRYAVQLRGLEESPGDWSAAAQVSYGHLPAGDYALAVRARDSRGRESALAPLALHITPHWYARLWARLLWLSLAGGALLVLTYAAVRLRTRRLAADKARLEAQIAQRTAELKAANARLETMAHNDGLTGVANRRRLDAFLDDAWAKAAAAGQPLSLLAIDVDRFKAYNDQHGHLNGDELLMLLVHGLARLMPAAGLLGRYGGDEFMAVLPGADAATARALAETMRAEAERMELGTTVSIGVAAGQPAAGAAAAQLVTAADRALYDAKAAGRNRVAAAA